MANWEKLNKEFEYALDSMTDKEWDEFKKRIDLKREEKQALNLHSVSYSIAQEYAVFCIMCDRKGNPLLEIDDYIKQYCS